MKLGVLGFRTELGATVHKTRLEECPPEGEEYGLPVCVPQRGGAVSGTHQLERVFDRVALQPIADQRYTHVDLIDPRQTLEQVWEHRFPLHALNQVFSLVGLA